MQTINRLRKRAADLERIVDYTPADGAPDWAWNRAVERAEQAGEELERLEPLLELADAVETLARALNEVIWAVEIQHPAEREQRLSHASALLMPLLGIDAREGEDDEWPHEAEPPDPAAGYAQAMSDQDERRQEMGWTDLGTEEVGD